MVDLFRYLRSRHLHRIYGTAVMLRTARHAQATCSRAITDSCMLHDTGICLEEITDL